MTLNGVTALPPRNFTEFGSFRVDYVKLVEDTPILSAMKM